MTTSLTVETVIKLKGRVVVMVTMMSIMNISETRSVTPDP